MVAKKKVVKKVAAKKKAKKPTVRKFDVTDVLHQKVLIMDADIDDRISNLQDEMRRSQIAVLEALAKRPDVDAEFLHNRIVVLELQVKDLSAKLLELSPELS